MEINRGQVGPRRQPQRKWWALLPINVGSVECGPTHAPGFLWRVSAITVGVRTMAAMDSIRCSLPPYLCIDRHGLDDTLQLSPASSPPSIYMFLLPRFPVLPI